MQAMRFQTPLALMMVVVLALSAVARGDMLPEGWQYRRPLAFKQIVSDAPGENVAWAEFYTNGQHKPDGSDLRVTTNDRQIVPHKVMQVSGENDLVRIAFQTHGDGPYYVWWGNAKAAKPEKELEVRRGIFVEVYQYPGGVAENAERLAKVFERAKAPVGEVFVNEIFLGHNPLGEEWNLLLRYGGQFKIDKDVTASLAFTVNDTGWLKIDGKMVAQEYRRGIQGDVRNPKVLDLKPGWHSIEVTQANQNGGPTAVVVAWKRPGDKGYGPVSGALFAQAAAATAGPLEKIGTTYAADFSVDPAAEAFSPPDAYLQRYTFEAVFPSTYKPTLTWDFGDGQTAPGGLRKINHYYMMPGIYAVTLKVEQGPNSFAVTQRISIKDRMYARFPYPPDDAIRTVTSVFKDYNLAKLSGEQAFHGMMILKKHGENDSYVAWGRTWAGLKDGPPDRVVFDEVFDLARLLQLRKQYKESAEVYLAAAGKPIGMEMRLNLLRYFAMTSCDYLDDAAGAMKELNGWDKKINEANRVQMHALLTAKIYAAVALGDEKMVKAAMVEAGTRRNLPYNEQEIRQGVLARNIESYVRTKDFDTALKLIDQWELEYPEAIWDGFTRTLRVRLYAAEGRPMVAARVALELAKANTQGFYAAELLYRASQNFKAAGEETQAKAALDLLKSKYPESPYARDKVKQE